jgi:hypothetical protein
MGKNSSSPQQVLFEASYLFFHIPESIVGLLQRYCPETNVISGPDLPQQLKIC